MNAPHVGVLRHTLYLRSEQFIPLQASLIGLPVTMLARDPIVFNDVHLPTVTLNDLGPGAVARYRLGDVTPLVSILRREAVNVLHAHFGVEGLFSLNAARRLGIPHFTTFHGYDATRSPGSLIASWKPALIRYGVQRRALLESDSHLVCVSQHIQRRLLSLGAAEERTFVIPTGVDTDTIRPEPLPDSATVIHVARLVEVKGTEYLIRAMRRVVDVVPEARLIIVGDGPLRPTLTELVAELGLRDQVEFRGALPHTEVLAAIKASNVLCLPSVTARDGGQEGLGQVLLEAAALGRPTVATRYGGIVEAVIDGETGILTPERDPLAIADGLLTVLRSPQVQTQMGEAARIHVERNFDAGSQASRLAQLFSAALAG